MSAQDNDWCAADPVSVEIDTQNRTPGDPLLYIPKVYNMTFWAVYPETTQSFFEISEDDCLEVIANMNREYNKFNIFFKYRGINELYNDDFHYVELGCDENNDGVTDEVQGLLEFVNEDGNHATNSLNTYVYWDSCGASGFYDANITPRNTYVRSAKFKDYHTVHELGHLFGLNHTWVKFDVLQDNNPNNDDDCEHVTRDPNNGEYNANENGDKVIDTAAMPRFSKTQGETNYVNPNSCVYDGVGFDCQGEDYDIPSNSMGTLNFMNDGSECPTESFLATNDNEGFTVYQGFKMRLKIEVNLNNRFGAAETSIESLYEPYKGVYTASSTLPIGYIAPHFQAGFDYDFVRCYGNYPQPAPYNDTFSFNSTNKLLSVDKYDQFQNSIIHPNRAAIRILQIDESANHKAVQKCYNYQDFVARSGKVMQFNDGYINQNVTITEKDSTAINSPLLIDELPAGLYQIQKEFEDGETQEVIIQKGNN